MYTNIKPQSIFSIYSTTEGSDAFAYLVLPIAMREKLDIVCEAPMTEMFLHNLNEILIPQFLFHIFFLATNVSIQPKSMRRLPLNLSVVMLLGLLCLVELTRFTLSRNILTANTQIWN